MSNEESPEEKSDQKFTFYEDPRTEGNVIAVIYLRGNGLLEGYWAMFEQENSPVKWDMIPPDVPGERITEAEARDRHPRLFDKIDQV